MTKKFIPDKTRRPQRVASDTAHAWARNLRLNNSLAKLVLSMTTLYVQGDGICYVGIGSLAEDTELSQETVRRRLGWLESVGAIVRLPQWIDEHGRRNSDGRGRRTTDEIRLMMDADADEIEARAAGAHDEVNPLHQTGSDGESHDFDPQARDRATDEKNLADPPISPLTAPSLRTGPESFEPEHKPSPPNPPAGGSVPSDGIREEVWEHAETWAKVESLWGEPIIHQSICRQIWSAFTEAERLRFFEVVRGYNSWRSSQKRPPNRCNLQKLMRETDSWPGLENRAPPPPKAASQPQPEIWIAESSDEFKALTLACRICRRPDPRVLRRQSSDHGELRFVGKLPQGATAMAHLLDRVDPSAWLIAETDTKQFSAWSERIHEWTARWPESYRIWLDEHGDVVPTAEQAAKSGKYNLPRCKEGLLVPSEWPPPKGMQQQKDHAA